MPWLFLPGATIAGFALLISSQSPTQDAGGSIENHTPPPALTEQIRNSEVIRSIDLNYSMVIPESWTPHLSSNYQDEQGRDTFDIPEQPNAELAVFKVSLGGASSFEEYVNFRQIEKRDAVTKLEDGSMSSQYEVIEFQAIIVDDRRGLEIYTKSVYGEEESKIYFPDDENVLVFHLTARNKNLAGGLDAARKQS